MTDAIRFDGQVALVTGAGRGLGRAYARLLGERGAHVIVHDAGVAADGGGGDPAVADAVIREIRGAGGHADARYERLDTRDACEALVRSVVERHERCDVLIHNAGLVAYHGIEDTDPDEWQRLLAVNVEAPFWLCRAAFPVMRRHGYGRIVLTVSGVVLYREAAMQDLAAYSVGKAAQFGLMNALAAEGEPHRILINAISPVAATRMLRRSVSPGKLLPEHVAPGVVFLASRRCDASGVILRASGGRFSTGRYAVTEDVDLGPAATPEDVAANWARITGSG